MYRPRSWGEIPIDADLADGMDITLNQESTARGHSELTLTPGRVDWQAQEYFGRHGCHWLAGTLASYTGWPVITIDQQNEDGTWAPVHSGVRTPQGNVLEIFGETPLNTVLDRYTRANGGPVRHRESNGASVPGDVLSSVKHLRGDHLWWARTLPEPGIATYEHFARLLLGNHGYAQHLPAGVSVPPSSNEPSSGLAPDRLDRDFSSTATLAIDTGNTVVLSAHQIDEAARGMYGRMHCHYLAAAICGMARGDWSMATLTGHPPGDRQQRHIHTAAVAPDGTVHDIFGNYQDVHSWARTWDGETPFPLTLHNGLTSSDVIKIVTGTSDPARSNDGWWWVSDQGSGATTALQHFARVVLRRDGYLDQLREDARSIAFTSDNDEHEHDGSSEPTNPSAGTAQPETATPTPQGGSTAMSSIDEIRQTLSMTGDKTHQAVDALQQVINDVEEIRAMLEHTTQGSSQPDLLQGIGMYSRIIEELGDLQGLLRGGNEAVTSYVSQL